MAAMAARKLQRMRLPDQAAFCRRAHCPEARLKRVLFGKLQFFSAQRRKCRTSGFVRSGGRLTQHRGAFGKKRPTDCKIFRF